MDSKEFRNIIYAYYEEEGRVFPWRETITPWGVMVSEFMLQQTQTYRVIPFWNRCMELWPNPSEMNAASMGMVLQVWNGLGYNRRARYLKDCARLIVKNHKGEVPEALDILQSLPGIGKYTAGAIACFAFNYPAIFIETNIRSVIIHFFFQEQESVLDKDIFPILKDVLDRDNPRKWYWALMDYGSALKATTQNPNRKSAHYAKQSQFEGSFRQNRGKVIKSLAFEGSISLRELSNRTGIVEQELYLVLKALEKDLLVLETMGKYSISE